MSLTDEQNDACWAVKMGKAPNDDQARAIMSAAQKVGGDDGMAANALVRMLGGYGADEPLVEMLKAICEQKDVGAELVSMLDQYADESNGKPDSFDISQLSNILNMLLGDVELVDPASRPASSAPSADEDEDEDKSCAGLQNLLDSVPWQIFTALITAWALFSTDLSMWLLPKSSDVAIAVVTFIAFLGFFFEFAVNNISGRDYGSDMGNLFWWLDAVGTFSLIPDFIILFLDEEMEVDDNVTLARVARAARIGARLSRLTKVFRVKDGESAFTAAMANAGVNVEEEEDGSDAVASQVGTQVADGISKKVVVLVITLLVFIPIFTYHEPAGGIRQTKEEAVRMLQSIKVATSPGMGVCFPGGVTNALPGQELLPKRNTGGTGDPLTDGVPYVGYPNFRTEPDDRTASLAEKKAADWSPCCGMKPGDAADGEEFSQDNLVANTDCVATCTDPTNGNQKALGDCTDDDISFVGMTAAERLSLIEFLFLQGDKVIMFTWDRGIAMGEEQCVALNGVAGCSGDTGGGDGQTVDPLCKAWQCASDSFQPPNPKIGEEAPKTNLVAHGPGMFFKMPQRLYDLRKAEIRKYGDSVEECTVANECMTEDERAKKPETYYQFNGLEFWVDLQEQTVSEAKTQIAYMWFIIVIFAIASLVFMSSLQSLVIDPVENMTKAMAIVTSSLIDLGGSSTNSDGEAAYIEQSILKIVGLLNVSFGEAGTKIIQKNMSSGSSEIESAVPGERVNGVYGFSDIREFTATTEALNQDIVLFVNEFAEICHGRAIETGGAPNKNVGDAFLCVWIEGRAPDDMADKALESYRQAIQSIRDSPKLTKLIARADVQKRFPAADREFGTYLPSMGFGLHYGWSIEGAIGTNLKMDAAYLGGDVDLADVLEANTKEYKTPILMTEQFYNQLSEPVQKTCRKVDRVIGGAATEPFDLYAANVSKTAAILQSRVVWLLASVFPSDLRTFLHHRWPAQKGAISTVTSRRMCGRRVCLRSRASRRRRAARGLLGVTPHGGWSSSIRGTTTSRRRWTSTLLVTGARPRCAPAPRQGLSSRIGRLMRVWCWVQAGLRTCLADRPWDGPGLKLQAFIKEQGGKAPRGWKGYQELA